VEDTRPKSREKTQNPIYTLVNKLLEENQCGRELLILNDRKLHELFAMRRGAGLRSQGKY
jgi:hypothetical protein